MIIKKSLWASQGSLCAWSWAHCSDQHDRPLFQHKSSPSQQDSTAHVPHLEVELRNISMPTKSHCLWAQSWHATHPRRKVLSGSVIYDSSWRVFSLHVWNCIFLQVAYKKWNLTVPSPHAAFWRNKRGEQELSVSSLLFLSALTMYITGPEAFFKQWLFQCLK